MAQITGQPPIDMRLLIYILSMFPIICNAQIMMDYEKYEPFVMTIKTDNPGVTGSSSYRFNMTDNDNSFDVFWGDGSYNTYKQTGAVDISHTYPSPGTYQVKIYGRLKGFRGGAATADAHKILSIESWGNSFVAKGASFQDCDSLKYVTATGGPVIETGTGLNSFFEACNGLDSIDLRGWDVSNAVNLNQFFRNSSNLKYANVSTWDVSNVTTFVSFFGSTKIDTGFVTNWDVSNGTNLGSFYSGCTNLKVPNVGLWDVSKATNLSQFFRDCSSLVNSEVKDWNTSSCTNFSFFYYLCSSLKDHQTNNFNVSKATTLNLMFNGCVAIDTMDLSNWTLNTISNVTCTTMFGQIKNPSTFGINGWDMSMVTSITSMLTGTGARSDIISGWDIGNVTSATNFASGATTIFPTSEYDQILINWEAQAPNTGISISFGGSKYTLGGAAETARNSLISTYGWTITDGGGI